MQYMVVCHLYPTLKIYKGGHETPRGCILLREHDGNMVSGFFGIYFFIKMLPFSVGVACGAKQFLYFTPEMICSRYVFLLGRPQAQKIDDF